VAEVSLLDWEEDNAERIILLDPTISPHEQIEKRFKRSKKLRLGQPHAERLLLIAKQDLSFKIEQNEILQKISSLEVLKEYCHFHKISWLKPTSTPTKKVTPLKPYRSYLSDSGMEIWVGKSAKDNDLMTFQHANGSDWWLHARDYPGSHVVIRTIKGKDPDESSLADAAELALRFSKNKDKGEVSLTQVKWLKRIKSAPGKVMLSKHKVLYVIPNEERWMRLKNKG